MDKDIESIFCLSFDENKIQSIILWEICIVNLRWNSNIKIGDIKSRKKPGLGSRSRVFLAPWSRSRLTKKNQEPEPEPLGKKVRSPEPEPLKN